LEEVDAALALDPEFLAARSLREQILADRLIQPRTQPAPPAPAREETAVPITRETLPSAPEPLTWADQAMTDAMDLPIRPLEPSSSGSTEGPAVDFGPPAFPEGYTRFEERAKRRRVDRRIDAARAAIAHGKVRDAASALDEVRELDPNLPELVSLEAAYASLRGSQTRPRRGPWVAAAAAFAVMVLGASWIEESGALQSRRVAALIPLVQPAAPEPIGSPEPASAPSGEPDDAASVIATSGSEPENPANSVVPPAPSPTPASVQRSAGTDVPAPVPPSPPHPDLAAPPSEPPTEPAKPAPTTAVTPPPVQPATPPAAQQETASAAPAPITRALPPPSSPALEAPVVPAESVPNRVARSTPVPSTVSSGSPTAGMPSPGVVSAVNQDELQVKQALQRYRTAYEGLDARSAQAVWPAVNQVALARAFDGLESQRLTFEACSVQLLGDHASATCRGTARYVPKIGSREPRIEPRVWSFALRKIGAEWKIDSARTER
jgi:hypothetical protein